MKELEDFEYCIKDIDTSDEGNETLERLYSDIRGMYRVLREYRDRYDRKSII